MRAGERQVSPTIEGIRADHVKRYQWAATMIPDHSRVMDFACGIGYGTNILAKAGHYVHGFDINDEAIAYAREHYSHPGAAFAKQNGCNPEPIINELGSDVAISFETIEHIEDPRPLLKSLRLAAPVLLASVPNDAIIPWLREDGSTTAFHFRHYTKREFADMLNECGWQVKEWHGQLSTDSEVEPNVQGRTLIAVCERCELPEVVPVEKHIAIIGLGPSLDQYLDLAKRVGGRSKFCDEVWSINALGDIFACDLVFHMDDVRIQEIRAAARPDSNIAAMLKWIKTSTTPVVTSRAHPDYPALVEFPLEDVLNHLGHDYFNNTGAYAVAFAIFIGATKISLFGMDYTYPNSHDAERGRACVEFWLGQAHARGIEIKLPKTTTLMDSMYPQASRLYGYDTLDVKLNMQDDGLVKIGFTERTELPTAEEIEKNYNHAAPISEQHLGKAST